MDIKEVEAKSILVKSKLPDTDYVINPYTGCRFGCVYCYASFMSRYIGREIDDWGEYVQIKINAPEVLEQELTKLKNKGEGISVFFSSVTDPYQGVEAKYQITRKCLAKMLDFGFEGKISILTKSPIVTRDIDLFKKFKNIEIGFTITSTDDQISRYFEKNAPNVSQRLDALKTLNTSDLKTYAFVGPLLPTYIMNENQLETIFKSISEAGTRDVYVEHINLSSYILQRLLKELPEMTKEEYELMEKAKSKEYRQMLDKKVLFLLGKYKLKLKLGETIYHKDS